MDLVASARSGSPCGETVAQQTIFKCMPGGKGANQAVAGSAGLAIRSYDRPV